ncbi:unnamed protein product, partial [Bubo scandiacus]
CQLGFLPGTMPIPPVCQLSSPAFMSISSHSLAKDKLLTGTFGFVLAVNLPWLCRNLGFNMYRNNPILTDLT